jgi:nucleoside-diphosphate-sugar epimerase
MGKYNYLITGGSGFVGSNLVRHLVKKGERVTLILRNKSHLWRIADIKSKVDILYVDLRSSHVPKLVQNIRPDIIFHLASYGVSPKDQDISAMIDTNIKGTINLIDAVKQHPFKLFINTGSTLEYGIRNTAMSEKHRLSPINEYGITKVATTLYCQKESIRSSLPIITLRLFTPYGYFEQESRLIPSVILSALDNKPICVSSSTHVRDLIFIEDVVSAFLKTTHKKLAPGEIINIGSGIQHNIGRIVQIRKKITKSDSEVLWGTVKKQKRYIEPKVWKADIAKARSLLSWKPNYTVAQGLEKTVNWFEKNRHLYIK